MSRNLLTAERLCAEKLGGISVDRFYRIRARLERHKFPKPMPGFGKLLYDPAAVDAWFTLQANPELRAVLEQANPEDLARELEQRGARMVAATQH